MRKPSWWLLWRLNLFLSGVEGRKQQPNLLLIVADDLGYNDVSWNNPTILMPHLNQLANTGIRLEQHYSQTKCAPSRAALMTGELPFFQSPKPDYVTPLDLIE